MSSMHFMTANGNEDPGPEYGFEQLSGFVYAEARDDAVPLFRWRHPDSNLHFYTVDPAGESATALGYVQEHIECYVPKQGVIGCVPMYRWYDAKQGDHLFTQDVNGELGPPEYISEGVAFYIFPEQVKSTVPLRRFAHGDPQPYCVYVSKGSKFLNHYEVQALNANAAAALGDIVCAELRAQFGESYCDEHPSRISGGRCP